MNRLSTLFCLLLALPAWADYTLTITATNGTVITDPNTSTFTPGSGVYLNPLPNVGYCFSHWTGDVEGNAHRLVGRVTMTSNKSVTANFVAWHAPIGIPSPSFGITQTYRLYDTPGNRNGSLTYQESPGGGYFTHYVDNTDPNATDAANPCGSIAMPRATLPYNNLIPEGAVIEVHGGPYSSTYHILRCNGTAAKPIFVRGDPAAKPVIHNSELFLFGQYGVFENFELTQAPVRVLVHSSFLSETAHHVAVRNCEVHAAKSISCALMAGSWTGDNYCVHDIVFYANYCHHLGDFEAVRNGVDDDNAAMVVTHHAYNIWALDNVWHHTTGGGIMLNAGNSASRELMETTHHIYVGRNGAYSGYQSGLELKRAVDCVYSENVAYDWWPRAGDSPGTGFSLQYGPDRVWILCNEFFNVEYGLFSASASGMTGGSIYILGNIFRDTNVQYYVTGGIWAKDVGITFTDDADATKYVVNNTFHHMGGGIYSVRGTGAHVIANNILSDVIGPHIWIETVGTASVSAITHDGFDETARIRWGSETTRNVVQMQAAFSQGDGCFEADPLFANAAMRDFSLQPASSAIDAGIESEVYQRFYALYGIDVRKDINGNPRTSTWDIGAYEYILPAITHLVVSSPTQNSVALTWTVPGEAGVTGTPTGHDIRYSSSPLTEANWNTATQVQGEPVPGSFGAPQSFTITGLNPGATYYLAIKVLDEAGHASVLSNAVSGTTATTGNHAPVLTAVGDRSVGETQTLTFLIRASDADDDPLTYSASSLPTGAVFDPATRTFTWTPTNLQSSRYRVMFQVSDAQVTVSETVTITVREGSNQPPVLAGIGGKAIKENASLSFSVSATDPDGDTLTYSATGLPSGASFAGRVFSWIPNYEQAGSYSVTFTVSDGELTASEQITITVGNITDTTPPSAGDFYPTAEAIQVPRNALITCAVSDAGTGVDANAVTLEVNGQLAYTGNRDVYEGAHGVCRRTGTPASYRYHFHPARVFRFDERVSVRMTASDLVHNAMTPVSYEFMTEMQSFGQNQLVSADVAGSGHPAVATDSQGNLWAVWHAGQAGARDIHVAKRNGQTLQWDTPFRLTDLDSDQCNPAMAIGSNDALYVVWQDNRRGNWDVYVAVNQDGTAWLDPVRITDSNDQHSNPVIAADHASPSQVYVAWEDDGAGNQDIYLASSATRFISKAVTRITSDAANQTEPAMAIGSDNTVYLAWTDQRSGSADIYGSSSGVSSWSNVLIVAGSGNQGDPALAVEPATSLLHVLWVDDAAGNRDIVHGVSNGLPAGPISGTVIVDDNTGADQLAPSVTTVKDSWDNSRVYACWQDLRSAASTGDSDLYFVEIRSGAAGINILVGDEGTNSNQSAPAMGVDKYGQPAIVWADDRSNMSRIYGACSTYFKPLALASGLVANSTGGRIGTDPAAINDSGDASIQIPPAGYACDILISISEMQNPPRFASPCVAGCEIGPSGVQFSSPATVTIPYTSSGSGRAYPYWYNPQTGGLSREGLTEVTGRTSANGIPIVSFKTTHSTAFYILESSGEDGGGGGGGCALSSAQGGSVVAFFLPYGALIGILFLRRWRDNRRRKLP